jgi:hypothetical protein
MAEKKMVSTEETVETAKGVHPPEWYEELVPYFLFKDGDKYKEDVTVTHNGVKIKIPRGEHVMIKRKYAIILDQSLEQDARAAKMQKEFAASAESARFAL